MTSARVDEFGPSKGAVGRLARIALDYDVEEPGLPRSLVAKLPGNAGPANDLAQRFRLYEREARFYQELAGVVNVPTPRLYYCAIDPRSHASVLLLEDLSPAQEGDLLHGCTLAEVAPLVEWLARMHAAWWNSPQLDAYPWLPKPDDRVATQFTARVSGRAWRMFLRKFGTGLPPLAPALVDGLKRGNSVAKRLASPPLTLVHGDVRINNVFYTPSIPLEPLALIDWQTVCRARGPVDIACLFVSNLAPSDRRTAEAELLPRYHRLLEENGVRGYGFDQCWDDYRLAVMHLFTQIVVLSSFLDFGGNLQEPLTAATIGRPLAAMADLSPVDLLPAAPGWKRWGRFC
ncbi:MAG: DUF1679 domain-containing protein [Dehalococcoidia bacterium]|nr:DUF1679 domain-containing protein [Dehalococcoidia bacterium]